MLGIFSLHSASERLQMNYLGKVSNKTILNIMFKTVLIRSKYDNIIKPLFHILYSYTKFTNCL